MPTRNLAAAVANRDRAERWVARVTAVVAVGAVAATSAGATWLAVTAGAPNSSTGAATSTAGQRQAGQQAGKASGLFAAAPSSVTPVTGTLGKHTAVTTSAS